MGLAIDAITFDQAIERIEAFVESGQTHSVCVNSAQDVVIAQDNPAFRNIVNGADLATADGWPVVWSLRSRGFEQPHRVTGPDLMWALCARSSETGHSHFFYGGALGVPEKLCEIFETTFPGFRSAGAYSPPFRPLTAEEDAEIVERINASGADFVWIGISTPKQHYWMRDHVDKLNARVVATVGAAFDFHSGNVARAPKWMRNNGLEWLHRTFKEPRRLGPRYLRTLPRYLILEIAQRLGLKDFNISGCKASHGINS